MQSPNEQCRFTVGSRGGDSGWFSLPPVMVVTNGSLDVLAILSSTSDLTIQ